MNLSSPSPIFPCPFFQAKTTEDIYKSYSIPMKPAEKQQQNIFSYQGFNRPMMSHSHYPMYPTASGSYQPSGKILGASGNKFF